MTLADDLRRLGFKPDQIATATIGGKPLAEAEPKKRSDLWPGYRSKWEALMGAELEDQRIAGAIAEWHYEGVTLKLTDPVEFGGKRRPGMRYKSDFAVWLPNGRLRLIEVKGFARVKDVNRYKVARDKYRQIEFVMVSRAKGSWKVIL